MGGCAHFFMSEELTPAWLARLMSNKSVEIENLITQTVESMGYLVWHVELRRSGHRTLLRVFIDVPEKDARKSVSMDDCAALSRQISAILDVEDPISGRYILEVSSPGLDRALYKTEHYVRYVGDVIHVTLYQLMEGRRDFVGRIQGLSDNILKLAVDDHIIDVEISNIKKAKLIF